MLLTNNTIPTIYAAKLMQLQDLNSSFNVDPFSTLNEKFSIGNINPPIAGYPATKYMVIGIGGRRAVLGTGNNTLVDIMQHGTTDAALFEHVPFVLVPTTGDLTPSERAKYRIRKLITIGGVDYFAYYCRVIDQTSVVPELNIITMSKGKVVSQVPYVANASNLNPSPVDVSNTILNTAEGRHMMVQSVMTVRLNDTDIANIVNAIEIIYGDIRYATISEIGIVSAYDAQVTSNDGNVAATYQEVRSAQIMNFIGTEIPLQYSQRYVDIQYGLTNAFPLPPVNV